MPCQRRVLIIGLALFLLALGASVECRADGTGKAAVSALQNTTLLCVFDFSPCVASVRSSQATTHHAIRLGSNKDGPSHLALVTSGTNAGGLTSDRSMSGRDVNIRVASMGAVIDANKGRLALNMMLDSHYHGAIFNSQDPFEAMQVSINYIRAW